MHLDMLTGVLTVGNEEIKLAKIEARIMRCLIEADGRTVTSDDILDYIWPYTGGPDSGNNNVTGRLWRLKHKLAKWPRVLEGRRGIGYRLTIPASFVH